MSRFLPMLLLLACDPAPQVAIDTPAVDAGLVQQALEAARPGPLLAFSEQLSGLVSADGGACPRVDTLEVDAEGVPVRELWIGGCTTTDGARIEGFVEVHHVETDHGSERWLAGEGFSVTRGDELELYLDGAIESVEQDELLLIEAAATWCGGVEAPCADEAVTVDLTYSIYPAAGYPDTYDITVSGVVAPDAPISVEGSWSVNMESCATEPTNGAFALQRGERHDLGMDGALSCDGCATWNVQGLDAPPFCGVEL